jgi:prolyl-tRNA editing enzyme YbaK/EbsC (Cys-tRNA(Pro) deacylase)
MAATTLERRLHPTAPTVLIAWPVKPPHSAVAAVERALAEAGILPRTRWFDESTSTAVQAAAALGVKVGAIANSLVFLLDDEVVIIVASGAHRVDTEFLGRKLGGTINRAQASTVKQSTGQAIGGVAPVGHPNRIRTWVDIDLDAYDEIWVSAGHPHAVFPTTFEQLIQLTEGHATPVVDGNRSTP